MANTYTVTQMTLPNGDTVNFKDAGAVRAVSGKGLSTNDFTNTYKAKLDALDATIQSLTSRIEALESKNHILYDA